MRINSFGNVSGAAQTVSPTPKGQREYDQPDRKVMRCGKIATEVVTAY